MQLPETRTGLAAPRPPPRRRMLATPFSELDVGDWIVVPFAVAVAETNHSQLLDRGVVVMFPVLGVVRLWQSAPSGCNIASAGAACLHLVATRD